MDRKSYWNETYVKYWRQKVDASNNTNAEDITQGDSKTISDVESHQLFEKISYVSGQRLLDFGCGFGRFYKFFRNKSQEYYGIDISEAMITEFELRYPEAKNSLFVSEGECLPFDDAMFSVVVCQGVFDACYQEKALAEMLRVCAQDGYILLTGKNTNYFIEDEGALIAERNARRKGHPNYFSDVHEMKQQLFGEQISIIYEAYYLRRADMETGIKVEKEPETFYAWEMILRKVGKRTQFEFSKFSDAYSNTWNKSGWKD